MLGLVAAMAVVAVSIGIIMRDDHPEKLAEAEDCVGGFDVCGDEGLVEAELLVRRCPSADSCTTEPLDAQPYLEFVQLDGPVGERCGPGDCGAVPHALQQGWNAGRWRIIAPAVGKLKPPPPVTIDLEAGETVPVKLVYRDPCVPPAIIKKHGMKLEGYCPTSDPLAVGESERIVIGMVHRSPCWRPPDFAGSFWATHSDLPPRAMSALHGGVSGRMKLVSKNAAVFRGPAVKTRERPDEPFQRVPTKGKFVLRFHRIEGGIRRANCA